MLGAVLGDWLSYWLGHHFKYEIARFWPLSRRPDLLPKGEVFFRRWGIAGIFLGRFFGPLRSAVPLVAGICAMPLAPFQIANVASAVVWATGILTPGVVGVRWCSEDPIANIESRLSEQYCFNHAAGADMHRSQGAG